jgi:hypothetical protein
MSYKLIKSHGSETWDSTGKVSQTELKYFVIGDAPKKEVMLAVWNDAPAELDGLRKDSIRFEGYDDDRNAEFTVAYKKSSSGSTPDTDEEEEPTVSFNCGGGTRHVTTAISQRMAHKDFFDPGLNLANGINWNGQYGDNCDFAGVDVPSADLQETYTKVMNISSLTTAFRRKVAGLVGCVNANTFKGWEPGEVMFLGCSFSGVDRARESVTVSFNFSIKPNEKNVKLGNIPLGDVAGWDYVWTLKPKTIWSNNSVKTELEYAFVAQVAPRKDFSALGL